ncbi:MAG: DUF721 domain-containing protein [Prevotellaceae bacterium]|jgi:hypothetical protein|nr:DUF721 domain-containing protein [Prevotellaceae bacterium]
MRRSKPILANDLLALFVKEFHLEKGLKEHRFFQLWTEVTGVSVAGVTIGKKLYNKKLYIYLSSSVVRHELFMMRSDIVKELNRRMGEEMIDELILK